MSSLEGLQTQFLDMSEFFLIQAADAAEPVDSEGSPSSRQRERCIEVEESTREVEAKDVEVEQDEQWHAQREQNCTEGPEPVQDQASEEGPSEPPAQQDSESQ